MNEPAPPPGDTHRWRRLRRLRALAALALCGWAGLAYLALPFAWRHYEHEPRLGGGEMLAVNAQDIPGDPINVGFIGAEADVLCSFHNAGWSPASAVTWTSSIGIVGSVLLRRPDDAAPVSPLYYDGRSEDLAFELPDGVSADTRHHVRLWRAIDAEGQSPAIWLGSASYDRGVGLSHYTLQVTHHIAPDLDAERRFLVDTFEKAGRIARRFEVSGIGPTLNGRNAGGDRYFTDGEIALMQLVPGCETRPERTPEILSNPPLVSLKNRVWRWMESIL